MSKKDNGIHIAVFDDPPVTGAKLIDYRSNPPTQIGFTIGIPQTCRNLRNPTPSTSCYGTVEWIKEVLFSDNPSTVAKAKVDYPASRLKTGPEALGCGAVTAQARVTRVTSDGSGGYIEQVLSPDNGFFTLVGALGTTTPDSHGVVIATEIWIHDLPWPANDPQVAKMMQFVDGLHLPPHCL